MIVSSVSGGGSLGAIVATSLASRAPGFLDLSVAGRLLLTAWIASWMVVGLLLGLLMGVLLGLPLASLPDPYGWLLPIGVSVVLGFGMMGLSVAERGDLLQGLRDLGLVARPAQAGGRAEASDGPHVYVDTGAIIDGR